MQHYFIVVPVQVIADDLAASIRAFDPTAQVDCFQACGHAMEALDRMTPAAVLIHCDPAGFQTSPLARALADRGIPRAFLGVSDGPAVDDALILDSPFSDATVASLLRELLSVSVPQAKR